jgi:hypothetical protein
LVWLHIQVNAVEPFPRVAPIELHDAADPAHQFVSVLAWLVGVDAR